MWTILAFFAGFVSGVFALVIVASIAVSFTDKPVESEQDNFTNSSGRTT